MTDTSDMSELNDALSQVVQIMSKLRIFGLQITVSKNAKQVKASARMIDGRFLYATKSIDGSIQWENDGTGRRLG